MEKRYKKIFNEIEINPIHLGATAETTKESSIDYFKFIKNSIDSFRQSENIIDNLIEEIQKQLYSESKVTKVILNKFDFHIKGTIRCYFTLKFDKKLIISKDKSEDDDEDLIKLILKKDFKKNIILASVSSKEVKLFLEIIKN